MRSFAWWPTLIVLAIAVFTDLRSRRIPNWLVLPFLLAGVAVSPWRSDWRGNGHGFGWHGLGQSFAGMALGFIIVAIAFWMGGMGAGDVKLCAALGAWVGPTQMFWALFLTSLAGGILALCWIFYHRFIRRLLPGADAEKTSLNDLLKRRTPYAPAIAIGTLMSFFAR